MHSVFHNLTDWNNETNYMSRTEKTVFFDLYSMYLLSEKPIDGGDIALLERRLSCHSEDEKQALAFVLKDKFKKAGKYYKRAAWDKILKDYKWGKRTKGNAIGNDIGNAGNEGGNAGNHDSNVLSNAERVAKHKKERKAIIADLINTGIAFDKKSSIANLRTLHEKHVVIAGNETGNQTNAKNTAITSNYEPVTNNHQPVSENAHTNAGEVIVHDSFVTPTANQPTVTQPVTTKADQIRSQHSSDIENWVAPTIDEMRGELFRAGKLMQLTEDQYELHVKEFKAHYAEQALLGKPLLTDSNRKAKLRKWLAGEIDKQKITEARQEKAKGRFTTDNENWSGTTAKNSSHFDSDLPPIYHPSHENAKADDNMPLFLNGCKRMPLPGMTNPETEAYVDRYVQPGEARVAAYDRLLNDMQEAV
ncbi:DUF1376 domain-containing protein [Psychrobacter sp. PAMC 21119]|uniref:DUF1376 domain-containing protein n=1 Tax=Psychrobacter sp. PAMC 21119 TaxID=1112209 RepID=UPI0002889B3B|nr:DUF1376 domain-containing protein [Psychrobacter sp. PAMC 21119]